MMNDENQSNIPSAAEFAVRHWTDIRPVKFRLTRLFFSSCGLSENYLISIRYVKYGGDG